jgi:hypothetical protein
MESVEQSAAVSGTPSRMVSSTTTAIATSGWGRPGLRQAIKAMVAQLSGENEILADPLELAHRRAMRVVGEAP